MSPLLIGIVIVLIAGIIYLSGDMEKKDQRKKHLDSLVELLEAQIEEIPGRKNSYALRFDYKGLPFLYEDIEDNVFDKIMHRAFLRLQLSVHFNIVFTEESKTSFRSTPLGMSRAGASGETNQIEVPRFKEFKIFSNKPEVARELFADDAVLRIFFKYKNKDVRGKPEMALEIVDGVLTVKFFPLGQQLEPTVFDLRNNTSLIQNYLEDMVVVYQSVQNIVET